MSFKFQDGFDHYAADGIKGATVAGYLTQNGYDVRNATDATFAVAPGRRTGAHALQFTVARNSSTNASLSWGFTNTTDYSCFGFAMNASGSRMRVARIENVVDIDWDVTTGKLSVNGALGVNPLILNAWYYFEIEIDWVAKNVKIWANNELQLTVDISTISKPAKMTIVWGQVGTAPEAGVQLLDDFYVIDGGGTKNNARLNPIEVTTRAPTADISVQWEVVGAASGTPHYTIVQQLEPGKANAPYLQSNTAGATDYFRSNTDLPTNNAVFAVSIVAYARKGDVDQRNLGLLVKVDAGAESETQVQLTESFKYYTATFDDVPGGSGWNKNNVESLQFGIRTR